MSSVVALTLLPFRGFLTITEAAHTDIPNNQYSAICILTMCSPQETGTLHLVIMLQRTEFIGTR
jgi:hypothetical protein